MRILGYILIEEKKKEEKQYEEGENNLGLPDLTQRHIEDEDNTC